MILPDFDIQSCRRQKEDIRKGGCLLLLILRLPFGMGVV